MKVDPKKKYKTRDGRPVKNLRINPNKDIYCVLGRVGRLSHDWAWGINGKFWANSSVDDDRDLLEVEDKKL